MATNTPHTVHIHFGSPTPWELTGCSHFASNQLPQANAHSIADLVATALQNPHDFPSLDQAIVPGDIVALAVDSGIPSMPEVVEHATAWICERGTAPENMRIVLASDSAAVRDSISQRLKDKFGRDILVELHTLDDEQQVAYVAANEDADPIYFNRTLVDADVVVPIALHRSANAFDHLGAFSMFPWFTNRATQGQFFNWSQLRNRDGHAKLRGWADAAARALGLMIRVDVSPAMQNAVANLTATNFEAISDNAYETVVSEPADLVIAAIDCPTPQQDWRRIADAIAHAMHFVKPGGAIAVCSEVAQAPGKALKLLREAQHDRDAMIKRVHKSSADDSLAASIVLEALESQPIYLASRIKDDVVESLGFGVLSNEKQLSHLAQQAGHCLVLGSAQHFR